MLVKVLMCPCFAEGFHSSEAKYIKKFTHFYSKYNDDHEYFVSTFKRHPLLFSRLEEMKSECDFKNMGPFEMYDFCVQMRYLRNFRCYKNFARKKFQNA